MLLSVIVYKHNLTSGQWLGAAVVFAGITVEAFVKRKGQPTTYLSMIARLELTIALTDVHARRVIQEKEKAEIKTL